MRLRSNQRLVQTPGSPHVSETSAGPVEPGKPGRPGRLFATLLLWPDAGYLKYEPQEGDVIFQSLPYGPVVDAAHQIVPMAAAPSGAAAFFLSGGTPQAPWRPSPLTHEHLASTGQ